MVEQLKTFNEKFENPSTAAIEAQARTLKIIYDTSDDIISDEATTSVCFITLFLVHCQIKIRENSSDFYKKISVSFLVEIWTERNFFNFKQFFPQKSTNFHYYR